MPNKKDDVIIQPTKLKIEPFKKLKFVASLPEKDKK